MHGSGLAVGQATALPTITETATSPPYPTISTLPEHALVVTPGCEASGTM
jgi:hypothetical protein